MRRARSREIKRTVFGDEAGVEEALFRMTGRDDGTRSFSRGEGEPAGKRKVSKMGSRLRFTARGGVGLGPESGAFVVLWIPLPLASGHCLSGSCFAPSTDMLLLRKYVK